MRVRAAVALDRQGGGADRVRLAAHRPPPQTPQVEAARTPRLGRVQRRARTDDGGGDRRAEWRWDKGQRRWDAGRMDLLAVPEAQTKGAGLVPADAIAPEDPASDAARTARGASLPA